MFFFGHKKGQNTSLFQGKFRVTNPQYFVQILRLNHTDNFYYCQIYFTIKKHMDVAWLFTFVVMTSVEIGEVWLVFAVRILPWLPIRSKVYALNGLYVRTGHGSRGERFITEKTHNGLCVRAKSSHTQDTHNYQTLVCSYISGPIHMYVRGLATYIRRGLTCTREMIYN